MPLRIGAGVRLVTDSAANRKTLSNAEFVHRALIVALIAVFAALLYHTLSVVLGVTLILFAGVLLAVFVNGIARWLCDMSSLSRKRAVFATLVLAAVFTAVAVWFVGPRIAEQGGMLAERLPQSLVRLKEWLRQFEWGSYFADRLPGSLEAAMPSRLPLQAASRVFSSVLGILPNIFIVLFVGVYLAIEPRVYVDALIKLAPRTHRHDVRAVFSAVGTGLEYWLLGRIASMVVVGALTATALMLFGIPLALTLGLLAALFSFIPYVGPIIAFLPAIAVAVGEGSQAMLTVVAIYLGVQFAESYIITPLIQKKAVAIPPALLIASQVVLGVLAGVAGVALATPVVVMIVVLVQMLYINGVLGDDVSVIGSDHGADQRR